MKTVHRGRWIKHMKPGFGNAAYQHRAFLRKVPFWSFGVSFWKSSHGVGGDEKNEVRL